MKKCTKCLNFKDEICFSKNKKYDDGLAYWCRDCWAQYRKINRNNNLEEARHYNNERRASRISWFQELKSNKPCTDCNQIYEPYCMDYDHVPEKGKKIKSVSRMVLDNTPKEIIFLEIAKCDLVCLLCHNRRTHFRFFEKLGKERKYTPNQQRNFNIINDFKNKPCAMCCKKYEIFNMQMDHIDPSTKLYNICVLKNYKLETLQHEIAKCQVLCALCHRKKSIIEQKSKKYNIERSSPPKRKNLFYDINSNMKECGLCYQIKSGTKFYFKQKKSGLDRYCIECFNKKKRERRKN